MFQYYFIMSTITIWMLMAAVTEVADRTENIYVDNCSESEDFIRNLVDATFRDCLDELFGRKKLKLLKAPFFMFRNALFSWHLADLKTKMKANSIRIKPGKPPLIEQRVPSGECAGEGYASEWGYDKDLISTDYPGFISYEKSEEDLKEIEDSYRRTQLLFRKLHVASIFMRVAVDSLARSGKHGPFQRDVCKFWIERLDPAWKIHDRNPHAVTYLSSKYPGITTTFVSQKRSLAKREVQGKLVSLPNALKLFNHFMEQPVEDDEKVEKSDRCIVREAEGNQQQEPAGQGISLKESLDGQEVSDLENAQDERMKKARELGYYGCYQESRCPPADCCVGCARRKGINKVVKYGYTAPGQVLGNRSVYKKKARKPKVQIPGPAHKITEAVTQRPKQKTAHSPRSKA